jgi:hypothetical protein
MAQVARAERFGDRHRLVSGCLREAEDEACLQ